MNPRLARQLSALGVKLDTGRRDSLSSLFPPDFRLDGADLSDDDVAEVFLAFVKRGLIRIAASSDETGAARRFGDAHVCHFYRSREEMLKMTASYLAEGLRAGERCLWVLPSWIEPEQARAALRAARPGLDDAEAADRIRFLGEGAVYLDAAGALRSPEAIIGFWVAQEEEAKSRHFTGLRVTGEGTGLVASEAWRAGVDYERRADAAFEGRRIAALCSYSLEQVSPERLAEVLSGHDRGVLRRREGFDALRPGSGVAAAIALLKQAP